jgi:NitT/TauT family transport system ATP-binding protein
MMAGENLAVELRAINKRFPGAERPLFDSFGLRAEAGETLAIVGPSGCGKSTLLNMVALLETPDRGEVVHSGITRGARDVGSLPIGYIFQRDALLPWATVEENFIVAAECRRQPRDEVLSRARAFLARVGLSSVEHRHPHRLSGGQRQLVALAQSLVLEPDLLLLDEPFAHLDFPTKLVLEAELVALVRARRPHPITTILVTHDIAEAVVVADRLLVVGGYPAGPTRVLRELRIDVATGDRDPVAMREGAALPHYFQLAWDAMREAQGGRLS